MPVPRALARVAGLIACAALLCLEPAAQERAASAAGERAAPIRHVDREALMATVRVLSSPEYGGRRTGSPGGKAAAAFIEERFREADLEPAFAGSYSRPFRFRARSRGFLRSRPPAPQEGLNVGGIVRGTDAARGVIVISAHFDHLGVLNGVLHPGADDNASGVAVLLAAARHFAARPPRHTLLFAAFDAEEWSFGGARAFLDDPPVPLGRLAINVNLDMVSRNDRRELYAAGAFHSPWLEPLLRQVQDRADVHLRLGHDRPGQGSDDWTFSSDHAVFHEAGVPFLYFGVEDHPDYHGPGDTADRIDPGFFGDVADLIVETLRVLDCHLPAGREPFRLAALCTGA